MESVQNSLTAMSELFSNKMEEFQKQLQHCSSPSASTSSLASEFSSFRLFIMAALETIRKQIELLFVQVDRLDMKGRRKMILLHGVSEVKDEDTSKTVACLVTEKMQILDFSRDCISQSRRLGRPSDNRTRPLLIKFKEASFRDKVWFAKSKLKGTGITQSEFLTKSRHGVFLQARQRFGITKCWTRDGVIHIIAPDGSSHQVECMMELDALPNPHAPASQSSAQTVGASKTSDGKAADGKGIVRTRRLMKK